MLVRALLRQNLEACGGYKEEMKQFSFGDHDSEAGGRIGCRLPLILFCRQQRMMLEAGDEKGKIIKQKSSKSRGIFQT